MHTFCTPKCPYKKAEARGTTHTVKHTTNLPVAVMETLKPVFKDLAKTDLTKCVDGYTQTANESINSVIWKLCPKEKIMDCVLLIHLFHLLSDFSMTVPVLTPV